MVNRDSQYYSESGPNLCPRRVIPYSPIKMLEFSLEPIRRPSQTAVIVAYEKAVDEVESSRSFDESILCLQIKITA